MIPTWCKGAVNAEIGIFITQTHGRSLYVECGRSLKGTIVWNMTPVKSFPTSSVGH